MNIALCIGALTVGLSLNAQQFIPTSAGIVWQGAAGSPSSPSVFESCWCAPVYGDSSSAVEALRPLIFPVPVQYNGKWGTLDREGHFSRLARAANWPYFSTAKGVVQMEAFTTTTYPWRAEQGAAITLLDSSWHARQKWWVKDAYATTFLVSEDGYFWGLIDTALAVVVPFEYTASHHLGEQFRFSANGYLTLRENKAEGLHGVVDYRGTTVLPFQWKLLSYVIEDEQHIYAMDESSKRGYLNIEGEVVFPFVFERLPRTIGKVNEVVTEHHIWLVDEQLQPITPKYQALERKQDRYFFKQDDRWGVMNQQLDVLISPLYDAIMDGPRMRGNRDFRSYVVVQNGRYGLIDPSGTTLIAAEYDCLCGLGYYAPDDYYVELQREHTGYRFDERGNLLGKSTKSGDGCLCSR